MGNRTFKGRFSPSRNMGQRYWTEILKSPGAYYRRTTRRWFKSLSLLSTGRRTAYPVRRAKRPCGDTEALRP